jgi:hypothetical protein
MKHKLAITPVVVAALTLSAGVVVIGPIVDVDPGGRRRRTGEFGPGT